MHKRDDPFSTLILASLLALPLLSLSGCHQSQPVDQQVRNHLLPLQRQQKGDGCSQQQGEGSPPPSKVIVNDLNWNEVTNIPLKNPIRANSSSVGYLSIPQKGVRCTGFLITPKVLATNHHCIGNADQARDTTFTPNYQRGVKRRALKPYLCDEFLGTEKKYDITLLKCRTPIGKLYGVVDLNPVTPKIQEKVYVIHQNCDHHSTPRCRPTKKYSPGLIKAKRSRLRLLYSADTLSGSSGAPVFSEKTHEVVALHHVGLNPDQSGRGSANAGVRMGPIVPWIKKHHPDVYKELGRVYPRYWSQLPQQPSQVPQAPPAPPVPTPNATPTSGSTSTTVQTAPMVAPPPAPPPPPWDVVVNTPTDGEEPPDTPHMPIAAPIPLEDPIEGLPPHTKPELPSPPPPPQSDCDQNF